MKRYLFLAALLPALFAQPSNYSSTADLRDQTIPLAKLTPGQSYSLLFSLDPAALPATARVTVSIQEDDRALVTKILHWRAILTSTTVFRHKISTLKIAAEAATGRYRLQTIPPRSPPAPTTPGKTPSR